jgi:acyl carrier protein
VKGLTTQEALTGLGKAINSKIPQVGVIKMDWSKWGQAFPSSKRDTLLEYCIHGRSQYSDKKVSEVNYSDLLTNSEDKQKELLSKLIKSSIAPFMRLKVNESEDISDFEQLGIDSLSLVEIVIKLNRDFSIEIGPADLITNSTISQLADFMLGKIRESAKKPVELSV